MKQMQPLNGDSAEIYKELRQYGLTAKAAQEAARDEQLRRDRRLILAGRKTHAVIGGVRVTITLNDDPLGWAKVGRTVYGKVNDDWQPGCIATPPGSRAPYFHPPQSYWDMRREMEKVHIPANEADRIARRLLRAQMKRTLTYGERWRYVIAYFHLEYRGRETMDALDGIEFNLDANNTPLEQMLYREAERRAHALRKESKND